MSTLSGQTGDPKAGITGLVTPSKPASPLGGVTPRLIAAVGNIHAASWARVGVVLLALILVGLQPVGEPWWYTADSDGAHLGNALNLLMGNQTRLLDHPALPLQALLTIGVGIDYLVHGWWQGLGVDAYADLCFADPDRIIWIAALGGVLFLVGAVVVAFEVGLRMFGHWHWGVVAAMLYLAIPGHLMFATLIRPENILSGSCMLAAYLLWGGLNQRSPGRCVVAAFLIGHAITEKVHAIGMLPPLAVVTVILIRADWMTHTLHSARKWWTIHRRALLIAAAVWVACAVILNSGRGPTGLGWKFFAPPLAALVHLGFSNRLTRRFAGAAWVHLAASPAYGLIAVALWGGLVLPNTLLLDELRPLVWQLTTLLSGGGVNTGMSIAGVLAGTAAFSGRMLDTWMIPLLLVAVLGVYRVVARRQLHDWIWVIAAGAMLAPALGRSSAAPGPHYFAPTLVLLIPLVIRVLQPCDRAGAGLPARRLTWVVLAVLVVGPYTLSVQQAWANVARAEKIASVADGVVAGMGPTEAVVMNYGAMNSEACYYRQFVDWCVYAPVQELSCFPDVPHGLMECARQGKRPAYYIMAPGSGRPRVETATDGTLVATNAWGERFAVEHMAAHAGGAIPLDVYRIHRHLSP